MWPQGAGPVRARPPTTPCRQAVSLACQSLHCSRPSTPGVKLHHRPDGGDARNGQALHCCPHRRHRRAQPAVVRGAAAEPWVVSPQPTAVCARVCAFACAACCVLCAVCCVLCVCLLFIVDQQCRTKTILATTTPVPQPRHRSTASIHAARIPPNRAMEANEANLSILMPASWGCVMFNRGLSSVSSQFAGGPLAPANSQHAAHTRLALRIAS